MHCLSRHLAFAFEQLYSSNFDSFGQTFSYIKICYGFHGGEHVTIEEYFLAGEFTKYVSNTGLVFYEGEIEEKAEVFIHFTRERSGENFMLLDLHGVVCLLCDPEIATIDLLVKEAGTKSEFSFCLGNLSLNGTHGFMSTHKCNRICRILGFKEFKDKFV